MHDEGPRVLGTGVRFRNQMLPAPPPRIQPSPALPPNRKRSLEFKRGLEYGPRAGRSPLGPESSMDP